MPEARHVVGLALVAGLGAALVGGFAAWPDYRRLADDLAIIKLSIAHEGQRLAPCRTLTEAELAALPKHKRTAEDCPRGRHPVTVEVRLDDAVLFATTETPTGWAGDGPSRFYGRATVPAGDHTLTLRLRDTGRADGFDRQETASVHLRPGQIAVVGFDGERGAFVIR